MPAPPKPKAPGRPFQPGQSGNPGGKWKSVAECKELLKGDMHYARRQLLKAMARPGETVGAATIFFQYVLGKPATNLNIRVITSIEDLSDDELRVIAEAKEQTPLIEGALDKDEG